MRARVTDAICGSMALFCGTECGSTSRTLPWREFQMFTASRCREHEALGVGGHLLLDSSVIGHCSKFKEISPKNAEVLELLRCLILWAGSLRV